MTGRSFRWDWNVAVFCRNEALHISDCIRTIAAAIGSHSAVVTIIVNGSTDKSAELARQAAERHAIPCKVYVIAEGDKANAINQFFYEIREDARLYFFVDGYTKIGPAAFQAMDACLSDQPDVVAASGVAANGRTMRLATPATLGRHGHLHGQLHGLRRDFIDRVVARRLRLPIGLYYGDGLVGSMAMHDLDPLNTAWNTARIAGLPDAVYEIPTLSVYRLRDLRRQFNRKIRQMRGRRENAAIRSIVYHAGYEGLPEYSDDMIHSFLAEHGTPRVSLPDRPFMALAKRRVRPAKRLDPKRLIPSRIFSSIGTKQGHDER
jgi:hypothetical protein